MTNQLALKENEVKGIDQSSQTNPVPVNSNPYYRVIIIFPKELRGEKLPKEFFDYIESIAKPKTYEERILDNAMKNLGEKVEEPTITKTAEKALNPVNPAKPIKAKNQNLDRIVGNYHGSDDVNLELNTIYNKNGATLEEQDNSMAHYTIAGTNLFNNLSNNLSSKVKNLYNGMKNIKASTKKRAGLVFTTFAIIAALATGCGGVTPPGHVQKIDIPAGFDKDYFEEICFSSEYGSKNHPTLRWVDTPKFFLINPPSEEHREIAENKMSELVEFTNYVVIPEIVDDINSANVTVKWCELDEIPYGAVGYFTFSHKNDTIYKGEILIYKNLDDILTKRAILAEGGGILGVTNDSYKYDDSIFYQGPCQSTSFTVQDLAVGNVLYQLNPGTTLSEFEEIFENSTKTYSFFDKF